MDIAIIIRVDTDILGFELLPSTSSGNHSFSLPELVEGNVKIGTTRMNTAISPYLSIKITNN
jgi:hypothetical protein